MASSRSWRPSLMGLRPHCIMVHGVCVFVFTLACQFFVSWMRISFLCGLGSLINRNSDTMRRAAAASASCQDLFVAGSPCTPYSVLYNCRGKPGFDPFETSAGQAFVAGLRYIREHRPRIAILEQAIVCKLISIVFFIFAVMCIFTVS